ncbi:hypothetical protein BE20_10785 [Sorangium cellulosum]|uniref:Secreted protein n=1 Tax=Sorangium cellulosum TaxID=56 RepID=A0A150SK61_SORCE|nr:hypothetical protein BE18_15640 [Sorangium cellulosum]KYF92831.1 hypothetical protein BE20_10785 [Sorangium cellulosum]
MRHKVRIGALAFCAIGLVTVGAHAQYVYTRGPNHVNMSGTRCRAAFSGAQDDLMHSVQRTSVRFDVSAPVFVVCPITRRATAYYGDSLSSSMATEVTATGMKAEVKDYNPGDSVRCTPFTQSIGGSIVWGTSRYACSTAGGCASAPAGSYMTPVSEFNTISWSDPFTSQTSVEWGLACEMPASSIIGSYEATVSSN